MTLEKRIESFSELGQILRDSLEGKRTRYSSDLDNLIKNQQFRNAWFTPENVRTALNAIANELTEDNLINWTNAYPDLKKKIKPVKAGVIMAGNIPLAGFHDFLSVLISSNSVSCMASISFLSCIV